jgi:vancomycin resistance protein YoaR
MAVGAAVVLWLAIALVTRVAYAGRVLPGTAAAGLPLSGADREEAARRLRAHLGRELALRAAGVGTIRMSAEEAGLRLDPEAVTEEALDVGRGGFGDVLRTPSGWLVERRTDLGAEIDLDRASRAVSQAARRFGRRPFHGAVRVDPSSGRAEVSRPRPGRSVVRERLGERLQRALREGARELEVPVRALPSADLADVRAVADRAERYAARPLRLDAVGRSAQLTQAAVASLLRLDASVGRRVRLGVDDRAAEAALRDLAGRFGRPPREPRFTSEAGATLTAKGAASWRSRRVRVAVRPGRSGRTLDLPSSVEAIERAVRSGRHRAGVIVRRAAPQTTAEAAARVRFLIGSFTTPFVPGQPRVRNIARIARALDGVVVQPGAQLSVNAVAGPRTRQKGYVPAPSIADGELVDSIGGGVSQVATTMYNAAFFAGVRLDAHQPHSFYIDRYPPGREATLSFPAIDLRWTNDTRAPVVVRTRLGAASVTVDLLGDSGGRRVRALVGERRPTPDGGFTITVVRDVDGARSSMTTTYEPPPED